MPVYSVSDAERQMKLPLFFDEYSLRHYLEKTAGRTVSLTLTENSSSMISVKIHGRSVSLRLHRMFLSAEISVLAEIAEMIKNKKGKTPHISRFIKNNAVGIERKPKRLKINAHGKFYNLLEIYDSLNKDYFNSRVSARITWGAKSPRRAVRRRTLGSYFKDDGMIRINPVLDSGKVPRYYIEYVVYHEMLHADMDTEAASGRRSVHSKEFKRRERLFKHYEKALSLEKKK